MISTRTNASFFLPISAERERERNEEENYARFSWCFLMKKFVDHSFIRFDRICLTKINEYLMQKEEISKIFNERYPSKSRREYQTDG